MRHLHILTCQPDDTQFYWQTFVQLNNARNYGFSDKFRVIVFTPSDRNILNPRWKELESTFPEARFFYYKDDGSALKLIRSFNYIPLLRPWCLRKHLEEFPELEKDALFYIDSDVVFPHGIEFIYPFIQDDVVYMSDGKTYNNSEYFDSKIKDVLPQRLEEYKKIDVLQEASLLSGISRKICETNKDNTGAAQYLLKNMTASFFNSLLNDCCLIKLYLSNVNRKYFVSEDKGFQGWCADIYATNWLLWKNNMVTKTPKELDFSWATDPIEKWDTHNIYHDAGGGSNNTFNKRKLDYVNNISTPFQDNLSWVNNTTCSFNYCALIQQTKQQFNLSNP